MRVTTYAPAHPVHLEVFYQRRLVSQVAKPLQDILAQFLMPVVDRYRAPGEGRGHVHDAADGDPRDSDNYSSDLTRATGNVDRTLPPDFYYAFQRAKVVYAQTVPIDATAVKLAGEIQPKVNAFNAAQQSKSLRVIGLDVTGGDLFLSQARDAFLVENVKLIKSIPPAYYDQVALKLKTAIANGTRHEVLAKEIRGMLGITDAGKATIRAKLIARDQVSKYNGELARIRQQAAGIESYKWSATMDRRTRPDHAALDDGRIIRWDTPPAIGHPGEPIQCRCVALAVV